LCAATFQATCPRIFSISKYRAREWNSGALSFDTTVSYLYDYAGRRILKRAGTAASAAQRTRFFFNDLTEEIKKVFVAGAHADTAFSRYSLYTTGGPTGVPTPLIFSDATPSPPTAVGAKQAPWPRG
jgi:hypothetical protein